MTLTAVEPCEAVVTMQYEPGHFAERLRIRRGSMVRHTVDGVAKDYRVTNVSMPDQFGRVEVHVTADVRVK